MFAALTRYSMRCGGLRVGLPCDAAHAGKPMKRILLVKTSSLGDVVHNLPVVSDLCHALSGVQIDWVVEDAFAAVPRLHPGVERVIPVSIRRWRKSWWRASTVRELQRFRDELREKTYDAVLDTQGLLKSALVARAARGPRYGFDWAGSREPLFALYSRTFRVPRSLHAVERNRKLAGDVMGYQPSAEVIYGARIPLVAVEWCPEVYTVFLHATSAPRKLWPEDHWIRLGRELSDGGAVCVLPWGSEVERARSERLRSAIPNAITAPAMTLDEAAALLARARRVVGVDTGLAHLSVALGTPSVGIYVATRPGQTGLYGSPSAVNLGSGVGPPSVSEVIAALHSVEQIRSQL
jgi:heptosyltransferase I